MDISFHPVKHALRGLFLSVFATAPCFAAPTYSITNIGQIHATDQQEIQNLKLHINDSDVVTGTNREINNLSMPINAFIWDSSNGMNVFNNSQSTADAAHAISNNGVIAGQSSATDGNQRATIWRNSGSGWTPTDLGTLDGGVTSFANSVSDSDIVVGGAQISNGQTRAFSWSQANGMQDLGTLGGTYSRANGINNSSGWVVGESLNSNRNLRATLWKSENVIEDIGVLGEGGNVSWASAINDQNTVVGGGETADRFCNPWACFSVFHAFTWDETNGTVDLSFAELANSWANSINTQGLIVGGNFELSNSKALLWENNIQHDLNDLIPADSGWELQEAKAINNTGKIVGFGLLNGNLHAFLLTPDDSNAAVAGISVSINNNTTPPIAAAPSNNAMQLMKVANNAALPVTASVVIENTGPNTASNVIVKNILPEDLLFNSASTSNGTCDLSGVGQRTLNCNIGNLNVNETAEVILTMDTPNNGYYSITSKAVSKEKDENAENNVAVAAVLFGTDLDQDLKIDEEDNCINAANENQRDTDGDGYGNLCDGDFNNDGMVNTIDLAVFKQAFFTNHAHADFNGDGIVNTIDLTLFKKMFFNPPGPSGLVTGSAL